MQFGDHAPQVIRRNANIAVIHNEQPVFRLCRELSQATYLRIRTQIFFVADQPDSLIRELSLQSFNQCSRGVISVAYPEQNFITGVNLQAMRAEALVHFGIGALERL